MSQKVIFFINKGNVSLFEFNFIKVSFGFVPTIKYHSEHMIQCRCGSPYCHMTSLWYIFQMIQKTFLFLIQAWFNNCSEKHVCLHVHTQKHKAIRSQQNEERNTF